MASEDEAEALRETVAAQESELAALHAELAAWRAALLSTAGDDEDGGGGGGDDNGSDLSGGGGGGAGTPPCSPLPERLLAAASSGASTASAPTPASARSAEAAAWAEAKEEAGSRAGAQAEELGGAGGGDDGCRWRSPPASARAAPDGGALPSTSARRRRGARAPPDLVSGQTRTPDLVSQVRASLVGSDAVLTTPFGPRRLLYADWTASGRALLPVESYILNSVLPSYANVHSAASTAALQTVRRVALGWATLWAGRDWCGQGCRRCAADRGGLESGPTVRGVAAAGTCGRLGG